MMIHQWATKHNIPYAALQELLGLMRAVPTHEPFEPTDAAFDSEERVQAEVRIEASRDGTRLFRNNVGALRDANGRMVRYGLANDSTRINKVIKSGDLIGFRPVLITPELVGNTIAQFVSRECKPRGWVYTGTEREEAQLAWASLVNSVGGDATFENGVR